MDEFYEKNKEFMPKRERIENKNAIKAGIMTYAPSVILSLILLALSGLGTLLQFRFSLKDIIWVTFFISLGLRLVSTFLSKYVGSNLSYNKALYSDEMQTLKENFIKSGLDIDRDAFESYVAKYNIEQKKKAYKAKKGIKIQKRQKEIQTLSFKNELECKPSRIKKIKRLKNKLVSLSALITDEYIEKNISYIKVKYKKVRSYYFLSPSEDYIDDSVRYSVNFSKESTKEIIKSLPLTIALAFFSSLLAYDAVMGTINAVSILFDIGNMIFNFILGWVIVGKRTASKMMNAYINRQSFLLEFKAKTKI